MVKYCCNRCGKDFSQKSHFNAHLKRKFPCANNMKKLKTMLEKIVEDKITEKKLILINNNTIANNICDNNMNESNKVTFIDLFCGIGSFHYSFKKRGWSCVMACDICKPARDTYKQNYNITPLEDICNIKPKDIKNYDILCAGFPCQPFSQAGKHKGFKDERGTLFYQIMKFVKYHKPKVIILENVQALLSHDKGKTFEKIKTDIEAEQYNIAYKVLKCSDYGIPQMRKRLFIIAVRSNIKVNMDKIMDFKKYEKTMTLSKFFNKNFEKDTAYTIRCGGKRSPIRDKHNWDGYIVDGEEYRLSIQDAKKLQGFNNKFKLVGSDNQKWKLLGNTIPTIFTKIISKRLLKYVF